MCKSCVTYTLTYLLNECIINYYYYYYYLPFLSKLLERESKVNSSIIFSWRSCSRSTSLHTGGVTQPKQPFSRSHPTFSGQLITLLGMLDLSAAFDCVDHDILLHRLSCSFGIIGTALSWIQTYLTSRIQRVKYNGGVSETGHLSCSVSQGSVLGLLFFSLYTTDVFHLVEQQQFQIHGYADDFQIYDHTLPSDTDAVSRRFAAWVEDVMTRMASNRLKLNSSKNEIIWLGLATCLGPCSSKLISIAGNDIRPEKNVSVFFTSTLSFKLHVSSVARTCYYQIRKIRSVRKSLVDTGLVSYTNPYISVFTTWLL